MNKETLIPFLVLAAFLVLGIALIALHRLVKVTIRNEKTKRVKTHYVFLKGLRELFVHMLCTEMGPSERIEELPKGNRVRISFSRYDVPTSPIFTTLPKEQITLITIEVHNDWQICSVWKVIKTLDAEHPNQFILQE